MNRLASVGVELDRLVEIGDGAVEIALREREVAAIGIGARVTRIETDRLVEIRARVGRIALGAERHAAVVVQNGEIDRRVAAGIDQRRAGSDALLDRRAP